MKKLTYKKIKEIFKNRTIIKDLREILPSCTISQKREELPGEIQALTDVKSVPYIEINTNLGCVYTIKYSKLQGRWVVYDPNLSCWDIPVENSIMEAWEDTRSY